MCPPRFPYDDVLKKVTLDPAQDLGLGATYTAILSGARDLANNPVATVSWSFTTSTNVTNASFWGSSSATPATPSANDTQSVEVGVKFQVDVDGYITGLRFYKGTNNTGTHVGHLWTASGTLLATVTFANESATGWQPATFSSPVAVSANTTYVASYYAAGWRLRR